MKLKMKMQSNQRRRQQRNLEAMLKATNKPESATHFDAEHKVYYKQENGHWLYFESTWLDGWVETEVKADLVKIGGVYE